MIGRDDVLSPERKLVMVVSGIVMLRIVFGVRVGCEARGCVHKRNLKLNIRAKFSREKRLFGENPSP
jgi:hypothetical protein